MAIAASGAIATRPDWLPVRMARAGTSRPGLGRLGRLLFPHAALVDSVYAEVMQTLVTYFAADPETSALLDIAATALDELAGGSWIDADEDSQLATLSAIDDTPFFAAILAGLRRAFYQHPRVWADIGYPGSSKEHGGYKHRGFDDIDWLPEAD